MLGAGSGMEGHTGQKLIELGLVMLWHWVEARVQLWMRLGRSEVRDEMKLSGIGVEDGLERGND